MLVRDMTISMGEQVHMCKANVHDNGRGVEFHLSDSQQVLVHPLWLRERSLNAELVHPGSGQRLFDAASFASTNGAMIVTLNLIDDDKTLEVTYSDGQVCHVAMAQLCNEISDRFSPRTKERLLDQTSTFFSLQLVAPSGVQLLRHHATAED